MNVPATAVPAELRAVAPSVTLEPTATVVTLPLIATLAMVWSVLPEVPPVGAVE
ncbi:MAG: hypothetical protein O2973_01275 [Gemmatimonadetes bacterium]|nr:hypothetical protein [Gemmatimonadota bacterium]